MPARYRKDNYNWKGGKRKNSYGYWMLYLPEHPRAAPNNYVLEHIILMENKIGRPLRTFEEVHHMGKRDDNSRIKLCKNHAYHSLLHVRLRAVRAGVLPSWRKCRYCKQYDDPENLYIKGTNVYHRNCVNMYHKNRYKKGE